MRTKEIIMSILKAWFRKNTVLAALILISGLSITVTGFLFNQDFFRILPLYISLIIALMQSNVNRYALLLGGINSILYAFVYIYYSLYASALYAAFISFPIQIVTFIRWNKQRWKSSTLLRKMSWKLRSITAFSFAAVWSGMYILLTLTDSKYVLFDTSVSLFGILISILTMFSYIEYTYLMLPSCLISIGMYLVMMQENPEQITYLIFSIYCFVCQCIAFRNARQIYAEQKKEDVVTTQ